MVYKQTPHRDDEAGFTLVELAIVMIIIGLLIGGILKGQELIANAQVKSTIAQVKGIEAATSTFRDSFNALPGDMANPNNRLPNCTAANLCIPAGGGTRGNNQVESAFGGAPGAEAASFFVQLAFANLLTGVDAAQGQVWGGQYPSAPIGGGFHVGYFAGNAALTAQQGPAINANVGAGHYLALHNTPNGGVGAAGVISSNEAARIDRTIDDGVPNSGVVLAAGAGTCAGANIYTENTKGDNCNLYFRIQN